MTYYCYKITEINTSKYYIGAHCGDINDEYMGSGVLLWDYYRERLGNNAICQQCISSHQLVHRSGKFIKEILSYHKDESEMYRHESELVNDVTIKDPLCLNRIPGGKNNDWSKVNSTDSVIVDARHKGGINAAISRKSTYGSARPDVFMSSEQISERNRTIINKAIANGYNPQDNLPRGMTDEWRSNISNGKKGKTHKGFPYKWVCDGVNKRKIHPDKVDEFLRDNPSFHLGMK